jgi:hypothetical protein
VTGPTAVPLPARSGLGSIQVTSVDAQVVTMIVPLTRSRFSSDGGCSATFTGPEAGFSAYASLACPSGEKSIINGIAIEVAAISDGAAVIRIGPGA